MPADQFEMLWGIEEGDTQLKSVSAGSRRLARAQEFLPVLVVVVSALVIGAGQAYVRIMRGEMTCTWIIPGEL